MNSRYLGALALAIYLCLGLTPAQTLAAEGTLYQNTDDSTGQTNFSQSSGSMTIDGALESITGQATGGSFSGEFGSQTNPGQTSESSGTPGGGAGALGGTITLDHLACTVSYTNLVNLTGTKTSNIIYMFLRGQMNGFYFSDDNHWQRSLWLTDASLIYDIFGRDNSGKSSNVINLKLDLHAMGDVNSDGSTNEYDLSLLTAAWEKQSDCLTDLNRDGITDEYDLSLLISNWHG